MRLGIDIGGTFTDLVLVDDEGRVHVGKTLTTPRDPSSGVLDGVRDLLTARGEGGDAIAHVIHATTLVSNALIQRTGARTALVTTEGFRDVLEIAREKRFDIYDLFLELPAPLVPRPLRFEVRERVDGDGRVECPVDPASLDDAVRAVRAAGAEAVAVCYLHAYANPEHERHTGVALAVAGVPVSLSSEVAPEVREYERTSTTVANAYVQPIVAGYLERLEGGLRDLGYKGPLTLLLSSGGLAAVEDVLRFPIRIVEGGAAAGALIAARVVRESGRHHTLAFDMGGTTAKICLADDEQPRVVYGFEVARTSRFQRGSGLPIVGPTVELLEVGAGGGSIARIDEFGLLKVGPESAEAEPGPACYGRGGLRPTVTDADLLLGYLNPAFFLGGRMPLDVRAAETAVRRDIADPLGISVAEAAWGIYDTVSDGMASTARIHLAEKGVDARRYALVATGGAGPVHAYWVASKLEIKEVLCPSAAGVASALGLLVAPPRIDLSRSYHRRLDALDWDTVTALYAEMEAEAIGRLARVGAEAARVTFSRSADLRYVGQGHEVLVPLPDRRQLGPADAEPLTSSFTTVYRSLFSRLMDGVPVEALTWRLTAVDGAWRQAVTTPARAAGTPAVKGRRPVYFPDGGFCVTDVYDRTSLPAGMELAGPAVVEEANSTCVVGPGGRFHVDRQGNLVCRVGRA
ncbi:MAG: hydantoinase/oxoprolinase family protein [Candidatus Rokubacteria bacterium]|nr:hydantoinase/oxoprolinase family protein [Candidatus Rokubacteria bacterium]